MKKQHYIFAISLMVAVVSIIITACENSKKSEPTTQTETTSQTTKRSIVGTWKNTGYYYYYEEEIYTFKSDGSGSVHYIDNKWGGEDVLRINYIYNTNTNELTIINIDYNNHVYNYLVKWINDNTFYLEDSDYYGLDGPYIRQ